MLKPNKLDKRQRPNKKEEIKRSIVLGALERGLSWPSWPFTALFSSLYSRRKPILVDLDTEIKAHFRRSGIKVKKIEKISSSAGLPTSIGEVTITDDVRNDIAAFMSNGRNYYLVHTRDEYKVFVVRTNNKGKKVIAKKSVLSILELSYKTACAQSDRARDLLKSTQSGLERAIFSDRKIDNQDQRALYSMLSTAEKSLKEVEKALSNLGKVADVYIPAKYNVAKGLKELKQLRASYSKVKQSLDSTKVYVPDYVERRRFSRW